jgi:hypothetical protein
MIAISYRREDTAPITGRIYDRLQAIFGRDRVFIDLDSIPFGADFRTHISESLKRCNTLLVVIGPHWLGALPNGSRRIDDPTDFVRLEVAQALAQNIRVIPLLIDRTDMPSSSSLPEDLKSLAFRNALRVDSGADFHHHITRLCSSLQQSATTSSSPSQVADQASASIAPETASRRKPAQPRLRQTKKFLFKSIALLLAIPIGIVLIFVGASIHSQAPLAALGGFILVVSIVWIFFIRVPQHLKLR